MIRFIKDEDGQGMLEYVLIIALVAVVAIGAILVIRNVMKNKATQSNDVMSSVDAAGND